MTNLIILESNETSPETLIREQCDKLRTIDETQQHLLISFPFKQHWLEGQPECQLSAFVRICYQAQDINIQFTVTDKTHSVNAYIAELDAGTIDFLSLCCQFSLPHFSVDQPLQLSSISIPKPWGQEVWFTGIEQRGVSAVCSDGFQLPLPWVLAVFPDALCRGQQQSLILLKILDPLPQPIFGDLYFELHQEKREVYVVTAVDQAAWPNGEGEIRFGVDQDKRRQYSTDTQFRKAFVDAVKAYEIIRRQIDQLLDKQKQQQGINSDASVDPVIVSQWLENLPESLRVQEKKRRLQMESFTDKRTLKVGDVVKVPCLTPHSLQHGVRTVEFQTPVYERLIVSFAQKVLTQDHWNTQRAVELMTLENTEHTTIDRLFDEEGVFIERIVNFEDFDVRRVVLSQGASWFLDPPKLYSLCMGIEGQVMMGKTTMLPEQALLLTPSWKGQWISNKSNTIMSFLLADPK